jgi:hypothetical protein
VEEKCDGGMGQKPYEEYEKRLEKLKYECAAKSADPWENRYSGMRCVTCMFFVEKVSAVKHQNIGRCRRHAPTMNGYPVVYPHDWCGDHKLDETK